MYVLLIRFISFMGFLCVFFQGVFVMSLLTALEFQTVWGVWDKPLNENRIITHVIWFPQLQDNQVRADDVLQIPLLKGPIEYFKGIFSPCVRFYHKWMLIS